MEKLAYNVVYDDLLPPNRSQGAAGGRGMFWGIPMMCQALRLDSVDSSPERISIQMSNLYYMGKNIKFTRRIELKKDEAIIRVFITAKNSLKEPQKIILWENVVSKIGKMKFADDIIFPVKGGVKNLGSFGVQNFAKDKIFAKSGKTDTRSFLMAPARNWIASRALGTPRILVVRTPKGLGENGVFYTWHGRELNIHTMELVNSPQLVAPHKEITFDLEYLVFEGIDNINELCGDVAIDCQVSKDKLVFKLATAKRQDIGKFSVNNLGSVEIGELIPGKVKTIEFKRDKKVSGNISGELEKVGKFTLLSPTL